MTEGKFRSEMRRAAQMERESDTDRAEYWRGYQRGIRRAYHGEKFGTDDEHSLWMSLGDRSDERSRQRGQGYRDGLAFGEICSRIGRPPVGDTVLDKLTVPTDLKMALEAKAAELGISVTDARREAYRHWIGGADAAIDAEFSRLTGREVE